MNGFSLRIGRMKMRPRIRSLFAGLALGLVSGAAACGDGGDGPEVDLDVPVHDSLPDSTASETGP